MRSLWARFVVVAALTVAAGCATSPFKRAGNADDVAAALARSRPAAGGRNVVFLVLGGTAGPRLGAFDLTASKLLWTQPAEVTTRVEVGASVIVHGARPATGAPGAALIVARDIGNGAVLWQHPLASNERLLGYAVDGDTVFMVVAVPGQPQPGAPRSSSGMAIALDGRTGVERWRHTLPSGRVAGPAARGGLVAVPVESQYVILLDGATGMELAQVLSTQEAATFVRALPEGLFYGSRGIFLLAPSTARGLRDAPGYLRATLPPFVRPFYWYDLYRPEQAEYSAIDRNRILWRAMVDGDRARFRDDLAVVHDFRYFFAFDARSGALRWAFDHPTSDAIASTDTGRTILFVTADGEIGGLDATTGARVYQARLPGEMVRGATFDADGFAAPPGAGTVLAPAPDTVSVLLSILGDRDKRFPDVQVFAIGELGHQPGPEVTAKLLQVLSQEDLPPLATQKAGEALIERRDMSSAASLSLALRGHADYAEGRPAPPVELLARAIAALGPAGTVALPELAEALRRPETTPAAAAQVARALGVVGVRRDGRPDAMATGALRDFLSLYRTDPIYDADPAALIAAAEALIKLGEPADRSFLLFVAEEPHTAPALRAHLARALSETAAAPSPADGGVTTTLK